MFAMRIEYARAEDPGTVPASANGRGYAFPWPPVATRVRVCGTLPILIVMVPSVAKLA